MPEIPRPQYDVDAEKLRKAYEKALKDVQKEIKKAVKKPDLAFLKATEGNIRNILSDIQEYGEGWAEQSITKASRDGVANTLFSLGYVKTYDEALKIAAFSETNRKLTDKAIADTQKDLLAVTTNMQRQSITAVRKATSKAFAETLAKGINHSDDISRAMQKELTKYADLAIIDRAGRRWKVGTYTHMIAQTKMMEAHKASTMQSALDEGSLYGRISRHGAVDACRNWEGKIVKFAADAPGDYPFYDNLPRREIFHPNCRHIISAIRTPNELREQSVEEPKVGGSERAIAEFDRLTQTKTPLSTDKTELRKYMKELLENSEIDGSVNIKKLNGSYGQVAFTQSGRDNLIKVKSFAINSDHLNHYTVEQTLFHEFYHARYNGLKRGNMLLETWFDYEETATELASLFMTKRKGYTIPEIPAYSDILVRNLPLLKQTKEFNGLTNVFDFGENYLKYRFDPTHKTADWSFLAEQIESSRKTFDFDAYARKHYGQYVRDNIDDISLGLAVHHDVRDVSRVKQLITGYLDGERTQGRQFYDAVLVAMMRIGVK